MYTSDGIWGLIGMGAVVSQRRRGQKGVPLAQIRQFLRSVEEHGVVRRAWQEAGIGSPTTAYRYLKAYRASEASLDAFEPPAPRPTREVRAEIAEEIRQLWDMNPSWTKLTIARHLEKRHGRRVVSPNGVQSVLKKYKSWQIAHSSQTVKATKSMFADRHQYGGNAYATLAPPVLQRGSDQVFEQIKSGIERDIHGDYQESIRLLLPIWTHLLEKPRLIGMLLVQPELGSWLFRSLVQLAHSLIDTGHWGSALSYLKVASECLEQLTPEMPKEQRNFQEAGVWALPRPRASWERFDSAAVVPAHFQSVSLRWDDLWLEIQQYMGVVLRDAPNDVSVDVLDRAAQAFDKASGRIILPGRQTNYEGVILHDLASQKIRKGYPASIVERHLKRAEELLKAAGNPGMQASTHLKFAILGGRELQRKGGKTRIGDVEAVREHAQRAISVAEQDHNGVLRTNVTIGAIEIVLPFSSWQVSDERRIASAAKYTTEHGLQPQARRLLDLPGVELALPSELLAKVQLLAYSLEPLEFAP